MHHLTGSRLIVDLNALGFSASYAEVQMFEKSAAVAHNGEMGLPGEHATEQFVADNVDHNINTLDGLNTFHGMGMIRVCTPAASESKVIRRIEVSSEEIIRLAQIKVVFSDPSQKPTLFCSKLCRK